MAEPVLRSPEWWTSRLNKALDARQSHLERWNNYFVGNHPLPEAPERAKGAFRRWLNMSRSNWMALVVIATAERLHVQGIRYGPDQAADTDAWAMWQANRFDRRSHLVQLEALVNGISYVTVEPNPDRPDRPRMYPEHPSQVIVEWDPARPDLRLAAFKKWQDLGGRIYAVLYLPDFIYKLQSDRLAKDITYGQPIRWEPRADEGEDAIFANPLGVVPVVPFINQGRMMGTGRSEVDGVTDTQDRINETLFLRIMAAQYGAFRQRWATGLSIEMDETTGLPKRPFDIGTDSLAVNEDPAGRFGDFAQTDMSGYLDSIESDVRHLAAQTHTPPHYLLGEMVNLAAEAMKAAEAGLVNKVMERQGDFGESWEEVWSLLFLAAGDPVRADVTDAEIIWRNPEFRTEGQLVDALTKMATLGVPTEVLWERWGASPQEIARWKALQASAMFELPPSPDEEGDDGGLAA